MKIALCLSGQMRANRFCIHTLNTAFPGCSVDIYATVWDYEDRTNIEMLREMVNVVHLHKVTNDDLSKYKNFESFAIRNGFFGLKNVKTWKQIPVWNLTRIELMAQKSFERVPAEGYDFIVRSRFDTRYLKDLRPLLDKDMLLLSDDIGGSAEWDNWKSTRMVFDGFAAGTYQTMKEYYNFVDWLPRYFEFHKETLKAERTLGWYLSNHTQLVQKHARDILGIQINKIEWYNRSRNLPTQSLQNKQQSTFDFYIRDLKENHPELYEGVAACLD